MKFSKFAAVSALTIAALGFGSSAAYAAPVPAPADAAINVHGERQGDKTVYTIDKGSMNVEGGRFVVRSASGRLAMSTPLQYFVDDIGLPIDAHINGNTAVLTPVVDRSRAFYHPADLPFQDQAPWKTPYDREVAAWTRFKDTVGVVGTATTLTGLIGGGVVGCALGAVTATIATAPLIALFGAGPLAGCLAGAALGAPLGAIGSALVVGAPLVIAAAIQYYTTINAPFVPPKK